MNRTDRLVALVMLLQSRRVITAAEMAAHFEITERTVYRDLAALGEAGVPIVGEPGVGYRLMRGYQLPPVMFSTQEAFSLVTGGLLAERMTDDSVRGPMRTALGKLTAVLPADLQGRVHHLREAMQIHHRKPGAGPVPLSRVQMAMAERRVLRVRYLGLQRAEATLRDVEPLGLVYYLDHWHLIAWCRSREAVRDFRVDRIQEAELLTEPSPPRPDFDLADYLACAQLPETQREADLSFHPLLMESVRRHWGPALREEAPEAQGVRVRLLFGDVMYLARWLLSFGDKVCLHAPPSLRVAVLQAAQEAIRHHQRPPADR
jgi:predicted DNA-binding transcriptional regulator YafY